MPGLVQQPANAAMALLANAPPLPGPPMSAPPPSSSRDTGEKALPPARGGQAGARPGPGARRGETREQQEKREKLEEAEKMKCHLHKKMNNKCKFCTKYKDAVDAANSAATQSAEASRDDRKPRRRPDRAISEDPDPDNRRGPLELTNTKTFGL